MSALAPPAQRPERPVAAPAKPSRPARRPPRSRWRRWGLFQLSTLVLGLYAVFPVLWILLTSLKPQNELTAQPVVLIPHALSVSSYATALSTAPFGRFYLNSVIVSVSATALCLALGTLGGYAIGRLRFRMKRTLLVVILAFTFFPPITGVVPLFNVFRHLGLLNTYWALIIPYTFLNLPICVWLLTAYLQDLPRELEESATIDGSSRMGALARIILPVSVPGLVTAALIVFANCWNEFLYALTFETNPTMRTLPVGIALYPGQYTFPWGVISAATVLALVPLALTVSFFQKRLISGLTLGAVK